MTPAPPWQCTDWLNTDKPLSPADFKGRPVALFAFQILCADSFDRGIAQAERFRSTFARTDLELVGLFTPLLQPELQTPAFVEAWNGRLKYRWPIGIDTPSPGRFPGFKTFAAYGFTRTPGFAIIDRDGRLAKVVSGYLDDFELGAALGPLLQRGG